MDSPQVDLKKLTKPFPKEALQWRWADRNKTRKLSYIEGHAVIHRLNDATNNVWDMEVKEIDSRPFGKPNDRGVQAMLMTARLALTLPGLGTREGIGVQVYYEGTGEDLVKGCVTDALKKAATLFGVGLELYGSDYEGGEQAQEVRPPQPAQQRDTPAQSQPQAVAATGPQQPATQRQLNYLRAVVTENNPDKSLDDNTFLHGQMYARFTIGHIADLTRKQASDLIDLFQKGDFIDAVMPPQNGRVDPVEANQQEALVGVPQEPEWLRHEPGNDQFSR